MRMMQIVAAIMISGLCVPMHPAAAQEAPAGIVFIDLDTVFTNYHKTRSAEAQLKEQADEIKAERKDLIDQFEKLQSQYQALRTQAQSTALNEDARNLKRAEAEEKLIEVRDMEAKIRRLEETAQRRIDEQSRRARKRLVDEINVIIREHALTRGYLAIVDTSGESLNGVPTVVFYNPKFDITAEIISLINVKR